MMMNSVENVIHKIKLQYFWIFAFFHFWCNFICTTKERKETAGLTHASMTFCFYFIHIFYNILFYCIKIQMKCEIITTTNKINNWKAPANKNTGRGKYKILKAKQKYAIQEWKSMFYILFYIHLFLLTDI